MSDRTISLHGPDGAEVNYGGYARQSVTFVDGKNAGAVTFEECEGGVAVVTSCRVWDGDTPGPLLPITFSLHVTDRVVPQFPAASLTTTED